jgi:hypothetical protein
MARGTEKPAQRPTSAPPGGQVAGEGALTTFLGRARPLAVTAPS